MAYLLHHLLSESAQKHPDRKAVVCGDQDITYRELEEASNKLANALIELGVGRGDRVGIHMPKSINSITGIMAILKAGGVYVPIAPDTPEKRLDYIVRNCDIRHLLSLSNQVAHLENSFPAECPLEKIILADSEQPDSKLAAEFITWNTVLNTFDSHAPESDSIDRDLAYILYTSGSTGEPKGVMTSHLNSLTFINSTQQYFQIRKEDRVANNSPLQFNLSIFDIFPAIKAGATVVIIPEGTATFPVRFTEFIEKAEITVWYSVPSALSLLVNFGKLGRFQFSKLRLIIFAGEVFPIKYLRKLMDLIPHVEFYHQYGQTEAYPSLSYHVRDLPDDCARIPIGKPMPNFAVFAIGENNKLISQPGEIGELYIHSSTVAQGYWRNEEKTKEAFVNHPLKNDNGEKLFRTGDLVTIDENGNYVFLSRKDNMIKSRGYRIELGEIEAALLSHPEVKEAAALAIPDELIGNRIKACLTLFEDCQLTTDEIISHCSERIPKYMIPETVEFHESLPKTQTGKIDRKFLASEK